MAQHLYTVAYTLATYSGTRDVVAEDDDQAIAHVKRWARGQTALSMYSESYRVTAVRPAEDTP